MATLATGVSSKQTLVQSQLSVFGSRSSQNSKSDVRRWSHRPALSSCFSGPRCVGLWRQHIEQCAPLRSESSKLNKDCIRCNAEIGFTQYGQPHTSVQNALASRSNLCVEFFYPSCSSKTAKQSTRVYCWSSQGRQAHEKNNVYSGNDGYPAVVNVPYVNWFREAWPYIQGHRGSTFVIVIPGEVVENRNALESILQDISLLHGLGIKLAIVPGSHIQIDKLLKERGLAPEYVGAYRITDDQALQASMEAAGKIRCNIEAKLSRGPSIPILRRHGSSDRRHEVGVSISSGNFVTAKPRGVVNGIDFLSTGEVKKINVARIKERLDSNCIVILSNLGYSASGEVLNCNTYEVATACAIALQADKLLCLLDGPVCDENGRLIRFMTLEEADKLIRKRARKSYTAADYVKAVAGPGYVKSLGLETKGNGALLEDADTSNFELTNEANGTNLTGDDQIDSYVSDGIYKLDSSYMAQTQGYSTTRQGFAIGGHERMVGTHAYLSELTAAVFVCRGGVGRVHLLNSNIQGALLLELYTRDGVGTMIASDMYEGTRPANTNDVVSIEQLLRPLEENGVLVHRSREQLLQELDSFTVVERDGSVIACAALLPYSKEKSGEIAAFAVAPECRGHGRGDTLLDYLERKAVKLGLEKLFLLTTRTADWFVQRGFAKCELDALPQERQARVNFSRGSKYYLKHLQLDLLED
ncbi:probable amino-acid acetyltransferase NAGS2, chloroplastic isoform X2 [Physcomitrium patens]|uniref:amino-acid N-acetyltransferase n=1 Tax=Physcomitrium patens TaxID=3218 RepID=A0A2K1L031_PHYPA|nr:probable amino-acid acetyltransferase NAGS1, chloroplastic [Physcomitrium patens]PNR59385.1 hypothetical protein PHYPA_002176 [Physcomitrium patens]|eukprot:XP_024369175.1 probable amino-acid acetyltransferase NAGS1, chloroplastic [Physcomitrella patens]